MNRLLPLLILCAILSACSTSTPTSAPTPSPSDSSSSTPLVGGDRDEHGCIGSAGYTWCEPKQKCLRTWPFEALKGPQALNGEEDCFSSAYEAILWELSRKYGSTQKSITVTMVAQTDRHARAKVSFGGAGTPGGMILASKSTGIWRIVYEGNGSVNCTQLTQEEFPNEMLKGFCD